MKKQWKYYWHLWKYFDFSFEILNLWQSFIKMRDITYETYPRNEKNCSRKKKNYVKWEEKNVSRQFSSEFRSYKTFCPRRRNFCTIDICWEKVIKNCANNSSEQYTMIKKFFVCWTFIHFLKNILAAFVEFILNVDRYHTAADVICAISRFWCVIEVTDKRETNRCPVKINENFRPQSLELMLSIVWTLYSQTLASCLRSKVFFPHNFEVVFSFASRLQFRLGHVRERSRVWLILPTQQSFSSIKNKTVNKVKT